MIGNTGFLGRRCTIPAAHKITVDGTPMYRFQVNKGSKDQIYSIEVYPDNYFPPPFFNDLFRLLANYFLLLVP